MKGRQRYVIFESDLKDIGLMQSFTVNNQLKVN